MYIVQRRSEAGVRQNAEALALVLQHLGPGRFDTNPVDQFQIVQNLIDQGVGAIGVSVLGASSIAPVVEATKKKGVKLFTADSDAPQSGRAVYVAQATDQGLGETIIDELVKRIGPEGKVGIVSGEATASNLNSWIGFMQARAKAKYPKLVLLPPQYAGGTAERAAQISSDLMAANPDLKAIVAVASTTCPGVAQAIERAGKVGKVVGTGYCSPNTARAYLKDGAFGFGVLWDPAELGYLTVWAGKQFIDGKGFAPTQAVPGMSHPVTHDAKTGVLLLGDPGRARPAPGRRDRGARTRSPTHARPRHCGPQARRARPTAPIWLRHRRRVNGPASGPDEAAVTIGADRRLAAKSGGTRNRRFRAGSGAELAFDDAERVENCSDGSGVQRSGRT